MKKPIRIIGVPMDLGQSQRGVDLGPGAVRYAGLAPKLRALGYQVEDFGNLPVPVRESFPAEGGEHFLPAIIEACRTVYELGRQAIAEERIPIFLGGDHSIAMGTVGGVTADGPVGLLWIDAHGDFNTPETSPTGNIHGMPLAALCGVGTPAMVDVGRPGAKVAVENVVAIGVRDLDVGERNNLRESGLEVYTMRDIDERGIATVAREALERLRNCSRLHISFDMDSLDPTEAPGVGTPVWGGLTYREAHVLMEILSDRGIVGSCDIVEINPILDTRNETAETAVQLLASLLGKSIL
jgi:arginase